jgi:hypothetical protein
VARRVGGTTNRNREIANSMAKLALDHLRKHSFPSLDDEALAQRSGIAQHIIKNTFWGDLPDICAATSLDLGITLRDQTGSEVTLWAPENFGEGAKPQKTAKKREPPLKPESLLGKPPNTAAKPQALQPVGVRIQGLKHLDDSGNLDDSDSLERYNTEVQAFLTSERDGEERSYLTPEELRYEEENDRRITALQERITKENESGEDNEVWEEDEGASSEKMKSLSAGEGQ